MNLFALPHQAACPIVPAIQIDITSGYYSQVAGALAGLCFTALVLLLGASGDHVHSARKNPAALMALLVTLVGLVATMVTYSVIAGEKPPSGEFIGGRAAAEELVAGTTFTISVITLFYALVLLLEAWPECRGVARAARWVTVALLPTMGLMFIALGSQDSEYLRSRPDGSGNPTICDGSHSVVNVGAILLCCVAVIQIVVMAFGGRQRWIWPRLPTWITGARSAISVIALVWSSAALVIFGGLSLKAETWVPARPLVLSYLILVAVLVSVLGCLIRFSESAVIPPESRNTCDADENAGTG